MIEKGKGPVLGKLRTIQLIEADLKPIMRILVNIRNKRNIESDNRVSNRNYGSRPGHSIEDAILENRLFFDNSLVTGKHTIYATKDLQDFYDRQISKIGSIVQESAWLESKLILLVTKMLPIMEHYVRTAFVISQEFYGGRGYTLSRAGQYNVVLENVWKYSSWVMLRDIEKEKLGVVITLLLAE